MSLRSLHYAHKQHSKKISEKSCDTATDSKEAYVSRSVMLWHRGVWKKGENYTDRAIERRVEYTAKNMKILCALGNKRIEKISDRRAEKCYRKHVTP